MGAAEQQQFSQYPLRYGDGTLGAAIAQTRDGKDELVTPVALWELDDTSGLYLPPGLSQNPRRPRVDAQLSGSNVTFVERDSTPLPPGGMRNSGWQSAADGRATALIVDADSIVQVSLLVRDVAGGTDGEEIQVTVDPTFGVPDLGPRVVGPVRPGHAEYVWRWSLPNGLAQTRLRVTEVLDYSPRVSRQVWQFRAVTKAEIRDTSWHSYITDGTATFHRVRIKGLGDGTHPIFVKNGLDQKISVNIHYLVGADFAPVLGSYEVAAGATDLKTNQDFPGLDIPVSQMYLQIKAAAPPTTGAVDAFVLGYQG